MSSHTITVVGGARAGSAMGRVRGALAFAVVVAGLLCLCAPPLARAQPEPVAGERLEGRVLIDILDVSRRFGWSTSASDGALTIRADNGILTLLLGSPDALWQAAGGEPETVPLSMPPIVRRGAWLAPPDALEVVGVVFDGARVHVPGGAAPVALPEPAVAGRDHEVAHLGNGVVGLRFFGRGVDGLESLSLLLTDLRLLALAVPEHRSDLDAALVDGPMADDHPLLATVTARTTSSWEPALVFEQGDLRFEARYPFRFQLARGSPESVGPDAPAVGVVLLPAGFALDRPLTVRWGELSAEITFRPGR